MTFAEHLRWLRKKRRWTLDDLATASGVTKGYLSQLENEKEKNPTIAVVIALASAFGLTVSELLGEVPRRRGWR